MKNNHIIYSLFPTPIYSNFLNREISMQEKNFIFENNKKIYKNPSNSTSNDNQILNNKCFKNLKIFIQNNLNNYLQDIINPKNNLKIFITESWLNYTNSNEYHHQHYHSNSFLSGVFYIQTRTNDQIVFVKDEKKYISIDVNSYNSFNSINWSFPVKEKQLIIFPSTLEHSVNISTENTTRISLAFNTYLKGEISKYKTTYLTL